MPFSATCRYCRVKVLEDEPQPIGDAAAQLLAAHVGGCLSRPAELPLPPQWPPADLSTLLRYFVVETT